MNTTTVYSADTLDDLMNLRDHAGAITPGFGIVYVNGGKHCWTLTHPPADFHYAMHPQRNVEGLGVGEMFYATVRSTDLRPLAGVTEHGFKPLGWMFAATGWSVRHPIGVEVSPADGNLDKRSVFTTHFLDQVTGEVTARLDYHPDEARIDKLPMPKEGWTLDNCGTIVTAMDIIRRATLGECR